MAKIGLQGLDVFNIAVDLADKIYLLGLKGSLRDQLTRASESVVLNISEAHPAGGLDRARRFQLALNEVSELRGGITLLKVRRTITPEKFEELWALIDRVGAMLYRLSHPRSPR
jgi:four helix bundle protein